jgi:hypothetical protein
VTASHGGAREALLGWGGLACPATGDGFWFREIWGPPILMSGWTAELSQDHPAVVFLNACHTGNPDWTENLAKSLLNTRAIAVVAATRMSNSGYSSSIEDGRNSPGLVLTYQFGKRLVSDRAPVGKAFYETQAANGETALSVKQSSIDSARAYWRNTVTYNLFGDPSLQPYR